MTGLCHSGKVNALYGLLSLLSLCLRYFPQRFPNSSPNISQMHYIDKTDIQCPLKSQYFIDFIWFRRFIFALPSVTFGENRCFRYFSHTFPHTFPYFSPYFPIVLPIDKRDMTCPFFVRAYPSLSEPVRAYPSLSESVRICPSSPILRMPLCGIMISYSNN